MNIQQVAAELLISPDTIRRWERLGMIPPIKRDNNGIRNLTKRDLQWLKFAKLLHAMNISSDFQIEYVKLVMLGKYATLARQTFVEEKLAQLQADYQYLVKQIKQIEQLVENEELD